MSQETWLLTGWLLLLAGCSASKGGDVFADTGSAEGLDTGDAGDSAADGGEGEPAWWLLSATIEISDGAVVDETSTLQVQVLDKKHLVICTVLAASPSVTAAEIAPDPAVYTWWRMNGLQWTDDCDALGVELPAPSHFYLGVGEMHPEILAVLGTLDDVEEGAADALNAAYASFDDGDTIYVYGAAGPVVAYDGIGEALTAPPLTDGTWLLRPIYPFPLDVGR